MLKFNSTQKNLFLYYLFISIVFIVLIISFLDNIENHTIVRSDGEGYYAYLPTLIIHKTTDFAVLNSYFPNGIHGISIHPETGMLHNKYPLGVALLLLPFFLLAHILTSIINPEQADGLTIFYQGSVLVAAWFYYIAGTYFLFLFLNQYFNKKINLFTIVLISFGTNLFHYATFDATFSHIYSFCCVALMLWVTAKYWNTNRKQKRKLYIYTIITGFTVGILFLLRNYNLLYTLYFIGYPLFIQKNNSTSFLKKVLHILSGRLLNLITLLAVIFITILPQLILWKIHTGNFITYSYGDEGFNWLNPQFLKVLFSADRGIFFWSPILAFCVVGLLLGVLSRCHIIQRTVVIFLIQLFLLFYLISSWWSWQFGASFGHRAFIDAYPLLAFGLANFLAVVTQNSLSSVINWVTLSFLTAVSSIQMINYWLGKIPMNGTTFTMYKQALVDFPKTIDAYWLSHNSASYSQELKSDIRDLGSFLNTQSFNSVKPTQKIKLKYEVKNQGYAYWLDKTAPTFGPYQGQVAVGVLWFNKISMSGTCKRPEFPAISEERIALDRIISPGESFIARKTIQSPTQPGHYILLIEMVSDGVTWFGDVGDSTIYCYEVLVQE